MLLKGKGTVFGCNALYRDFAQSAAFLPQTDPVMSTQKYALPDYLVAIDDAIVAEIEHSDFPSRRVIIPPEEEKWEPIELHWGRSDKKDWNPARPRSNAGMNAILEAIKLDYTWLYMFGFDSLVVEENLALSNLYDGTDCYGHDTRANLQDTRNRMTFLGWVIEKNPEVHFTFCYPKETIDSGVYLPQADNVSVSNFDRLISIL